MIGARETPREETERRRVVLLGASNLTKGFATVAETAAQVWGRPLEIMGAFGHGRSYGRPSTAFCRQLPGIRECRLWTALEQGQRLPTAALLTDIGNDLLYEEPVERIAGWVEFCLDRLLSVEARIVVTLLPVDNLPDLPPWRFHLFRQLFFPRNRLTQAEVTRRVLALNDRVHQLATSRGIPVARQRVTWYGLDPIHIRIRQRPHAWREILAAWSDSNAECAPARTRLATNIYLRSLLPEERRVLGIEQRRRQPIGRLRDGTTIALY